MVSGETVKLRSRKLLLVVLFVAALSWQIGGKHGGYDLLNEAALVACGTQCSSGSGGG